MSDDSNDARVRELEEEVRRLTLMLRSAPDFITRITPDGKFLYLNRVAPGYEVSQILGTSIDNYVPPEFRERAHEAMRAATETGTVQEYATLGQTSSNQVGHYLTRVSPVVENGSVTSLVMIATDVTALEQSRLLLQVALNATGLGIWTYEPATGFGTWDETTRRIFGVNEDVSSPHLAEMLGERVHPDDRAMVGEGLSQALRTGQYGPIEHRIRLADGERWVAASGVAVRDHRGEVARVVGSVMDITHRRALEARVQEAQKLESIGRLAGGVAHDFNNMLTAILGNVDFASRVSTLEAMRPLLAEIRLTAERSAALTAQLLAFARRQVIEPKVLEPSALVGRLQALLERLLGEQIELATSFRSSGHVRVDASQLEQVVLNLITNARDAMPQGGHVRLATSDVTLDAAAVAQSPGLVPGEYVLLEVSDDGVGIPAAALPQIFEPFFTTRPGGTGLGLATCYGIVKQSAGHISVRSEPGAGATFSVYLPRVDAEVTASPPAPPIAAGGGGERVLLVEDEAVVRSIIERTLERAGYRVVVATTAEEALEAVETQARFDLLITDIVMPGMNGWELGKRLVQRWPGLPVLYISGYTEDVIKEGGVIDGSLPFLQKPFLPADLLTKIRELLAA